MRQGFAPISLKMQHLHTVMKNYHVKRIGFPYIFLTLPLLSERNSNIRNNDAIFRVLQNKLAVYCKKVHFNPKMKHINNLKLYDYDRL